MPLNADVLESWEALPWVTMEDSPGLRIHAMPVSESSEVTVIALDYAPGYLLHEHFHTVSHIEIVLAGQLDFPNRQANAGDIRRIPVGVAYGPIQVGPLGARVIEVFPTSSLAGIAGQYLDPAIAEARGNRARCQELAETTGLSAGPALKLDTTSGGASAN